MANLKLRISNGDSSKSDGDVTEAQTRTVSAELAEANSIEERYEVFAKELERDPGQFDADCEKVGDLLERNDLRGLLKHGGQHTRERAEARAAVIRSNR